MKLEWNNDTAGWASVVLLIASVMDEIADLRKEVAELKRVCPGVVQPGVVYDKVSGRIIRRPDAGNTAKPGMAWSDIARESYNAYYFSLYGHDHEMYPFLPFDDLPVEQKTAWEACARHAFSLTEGFIITKAERWKGWVPPHLKEKQ